MESIRRIRGGADACFSSSEVCWRLEVDVSKYDMQQQPDCRDADFFERTCSKGGGGQGVDDPSHNKRIQSLKEM